MSGRFRCLSALVGAFTLAAAVLVLDVGVAPPVEGATGDTSVRVSNLSLASFGSSFGVSPAGILFTVSESRQGGTDLNGDSDTADGVVHLWNAATRTTTNLSLAVNSSSVGAFTDGFVFSVDEAKQGLADLNGDGDATDDVVHVWRAATGVTTNLSLAQGIRGPQASPLGFVFSVDEAGQGPVGTDLNGDGDTTDEVVHVWRAASATATNLALALGGGLGAGPAGYIFTVDEAGQGPVGTDLNGDGDTSDDVVHVWRSASATTTNLALAQRNLSLGDASPDGFVFSVDEAGQGALGTDLNGDGDTSDNVVHVWRAASGTTTNLSLPLARGFGAGPAGYVFSVDESKQGPAGTDYNSDGDTTDEVAHVWRSASATATNLALALRGGSFGAGPFGFSFLVSEADQGALGTDLNADGDVGDQVVHVWKAATGATANLSLDGFGFGVGPDGFIFSVAEWRQGALGTDFNGDGDSSDEVAHIWTASTSSTTNLSLADADSGFGAGPGWFVFSVDEAGQGPVGTDFNGDGDTLDEVVHLVEINDAPVTVDDGPFTVPSGVAVSDNVLTNDTDADGDPLTAIKVTDPARGSVTLAANGAFTYTPKGTYSGPDSFTYKANDGTLDSNVATVTISVTPIGHDVGLVDPASGNWHLRKASTGAVTTFAYGVPGDIPFMGDWDCNGSETPGLYRQSDGFAYIRNSNTFGVADISFFMGNPSDIPLAGDFNGNGCDTVSIYRPAEQRIYIANTLGPNGGAITADFNYVFGNPGDKPFVGDFSGNGSETIGLHRESTGFVYFRNTHTIGNADVTYFFGDPGDKLVAGDWGIVDGIYTPAVFRPSLAKFFFRHTNTIGLADSEFFFGDGTWNPVSGAMGL